MAVTRAAFVIVVEDIAGTSTLARTKAELLHLLAYTS
jgi:hypothetical protein